MRSFCERYSLGERTMLYFPDKLEEDEQGLSELVASEFDAVGYDYAKNDQLFYFLPVPDQKELEEKLKYYFQEHFALFSKEKKDEFDEIQRKVMNEYIDNYRKVVA